MPNAIKYRSTRPDARRGTATQRGYDSQWNRLSKLYRQQYPLCQVCGTRPAEDVDHIEPFHGRDDPKRLDVRNLQAICRPCHRVKTGTQ